MNVHFSQYEYIKQRVGDSDNKCDTHGWTAGGGQPWVLHFWA